MCSFKKILSLTLSIAVLSAPLASQNAFAMKSLQHCSYRIPFVDHSEICETEFTEIDRLAHCASDYTLEILQRIHEVKSKTSFCEMSKMNWDMVIQKLRYARDMFGIDLVIPTQNYVYYDHPSTIFTAKTKSKILEVTELIYAINLSLDREFTVAYKHANPMQIAKSNVMEIYQICSHLLGKLLELAEITHIPVPRDIKIKTVL